MRHDYKTSQKTGDMRRLPTITFIILLQLSISCAFRIQIQQFVLNSLGCGKGLPCDGNGNTDPTDKTPPTTDKSCVGQKCNDTASCGCKNAACTKGVCVCPDGFREVNGECVTVERGVKKCSVSSDCFDDKKECYKSFCVCKNNYKFDLSDACIAVLGSGCRTDKDCENGDHMTCERDRCVCDVGYKDNPDKSPTCVRDQKCTDVSCGVKKRDSICKTNACVCPAGRKDFAGVCAVEKVSLGKACEFSWQCSNADNNTKCDKSFVCNCAESYVKINGTCVNPKNCSLGERCTEDTCCSTTTPGAYCDCTVTPKVCGCKPPSQQYDAVKPSECINAKKFNEACKYTAECQIADSNTKCSTGKKCVCIDGFTHDGSRCIVIGGKQLGEACDVGDICVTVNALCSGGICTCEDGYNPVRKGNENICEKGVDGGDDCKNTLECQLQDQLSVCAPDPSDLKKKICQCRKDLGVTKGRDGKCYAAEPLLGDPCEDDAKCKIQNKESICFHGHCHCDAKTVERFTCVPPNVWNSKATSKRFFKIMISSGTIHLKSKLYDTSSYPPNACFSYSVVVPLKKIIKITVEKLVLAEGTTVELYMEPWKVIAKVDGPTNNQYDGFVFYTYQNRLLATLCSGDARARGFDLRVEVLDKLTGDCMKIVDVVGTASKKQDLSNNMESCAFYHFNMELAKRSNILFVQADKITSSGPPLPPDPLQLMDNVCPVLSRTVKNVTADSTENKDIAHPIGILTLRQNRFQNTDPTSSTAQLKGKVWGVPYATARDCGFDKTVDGSVAETFTESGEAVCIWAFKPDSKGSKLKLTIDTFSPGNESFMSVSLGELSNEDAMGVVIAQYDYELANKVLQSSTETPQLYIFLRILPGKAATIEFKVEKV